MPTTLVFLNAIHMFSNKYIVFAKNVFLCLLNSDYTLKSGQWLSSMKKCGCVLLCTLSVEDPCYNKTNVLTFQVFASWI